MDRSAESRVVLLPDAKELWGAGVMAGRAKGQREGAVVGFGVSALLGLTLLMLVIHYRFMRALAR